MPGDYSRKILDRRKHYSGVLMQQGRVQLDADWNEQLDISLYRTRTEAVDMIGPSGAPVGRDGFNVSIAPGGADLNLSAGRLYVDGLLCELDDPASYTSQPFFPNPDFTVPVSSPPPSPPGPRSRLILKDGTYIVYLDAWSREVTYREDPLVRERALDGPDTTTRLQTVWQVKLLPVSGSLSSPPGSPPRSACDSAFPEFDQLTAPATGMMNARTQPDEKKEPCQLPPSAGFFGLENQLYRVEIQKSGDRNTATFKWSRENASVETSVVNIVANKVTVADLGKDTVLGFAGGQWVEIVDDESTLKNSPRPLVQIDRVDPQGPAIILKSTVTLPAGSKNPRVRRWDQSGASAGPGGLGMTATTFIALENGIQVSFSDGTYNAGDYWLIPARTAGAEIEWPPFEIPNANPVAQAPLGIRHHFSRLAMFEVKSGVIGTPQDCRKLFPGLINFPPIDRGMHIIGLQTVDTRNAASVLLNDTNVPISSFGGINVQCDTVVDPVSVSRPTCFVTVEFPNGFGDAVIDSYFPLVLAGTVTSTGSTISWRPGPQAQDFLSRVILGAVTERGILSRLTLKGNFIWSKNDPTLFLDGETFGQPPSGDALNVGMRLPSGDRRQGGDFEMWFWLVAAPSSITGIQASPSTTIAVGDTAQINMTLSAPAPAGSTIALLISNANVTTNAQPRVTSPPTSPPAFGAAVTVTPGSPTASFTATGRVAGTTIIQAFFGGQSVAVTLQVTPLPNLTGVLVPQPNPINVGGSSTGTISLSGPAPSNGFVVTLRSANPAIATVPANVKVDQGNTTATFKIQGVAASGDAGVDIFAQAGSVTISGNLVVRARKPIGKEGGGKEGVGKEAVAKETGIEKAPSGREVISPFTRTVNKVTETLGNPAGSAPPRLDASISPAPSARAFILAEERPPVGEAVLNPPALPEPKPEPKSEARPEEARAGNDLLSASARSKGKRTVARTGPGRKAKTIEKPVVAEKGTIAEDLGKRPV